MPDTIKIFLASSSELEEDRRDFEIFIGRKNKDWIAKGTWDTGRCCSDWRTGPCASG
jgi:hypothetical protein